LSTPPHETKDAVVAMFARHGLKERFQFNSNEVRRSVMWLIAVTGFKARAVLTAERELTIAIVVTNVLSGTALAFRKHLAHLSRPHPTRKIAG